MSNKKDLDYSSEALGYGLIGTAAREMSVKGFGAISARKFKNYGHKNANVEGKVFGHDVVFNTPHAAEGGGGAFGIWSDGNRFVSGVVKDPKKLSHFEEGIISHEIGHKLNFDSMLGKGGDAFALSRKYMPIRNAGKWTSLLSPFFLAGINDPTTLNAATAASVAVAAPMIAEETLASARGINLMAKHVGKWGAFKRSAAPISSALMYAGFAAPALITRKLKMDQIKGNMKKHSALDLVKQAAFENELSRIAE